MEENMENKLSSRDENGLLTNINYVIDSNGFVDWRKMIDDKQLYVNRKWFESRDITVPNSVENLSDHQLLIKLGGIKEVAKLRGIEKVECHPLKSHFDHCPDMIHAVYKCTIRWIPNFENPDGAVYEDVGSVNYYNADEFSLEYADTIAYNRAFVRCVRNFLGIHICSMEEINRSKESSVEKEKTSMKNVKSHGALEEAAVRRGLKTFDEFKDWAKTQNIDLFAYSDYVDIPSRKIYNLISKLNS